MLKANKQINFVSETPMAHPAIRTHLNLCIWRKWIRDEIDECSIRMGWKQNKTNRGKKKRKMKSLLDNKMTLRWRIKCDRTNTQNVNFVRWIPFNRRWTAPAIIDFCRYSTYSIFLLLRMIYKRRTIVCHNLYVFFQYSQQPQTQTHTPGLLLFFDFFFRCKHLDCLQRYCNTCRISMLNCV